MPQDVEGHRQLQQKYIEVGMITCIHMYVHMCICTYICAYIYIHIYTYTYAAGY